jgi:nucleotidyltransferase substrate binding protein (TIGR01987 family)
LLGAALVPPPANDRERDGAIQRFKYTFELAWKTSKRFLADLGIESLSPKSVIRDLAQQNLIDDAEAWLNFLRARNETSHIYKEEVASRVFSQIHSFHSECQKLLESIKASES